MDVRCPQCQTIYELDDDQVGARSVTLKCSQCQHVFRLEGRNAIVQENQRRWMIRRQDEGDILYLNTFDRLHEWIMKQEVEKGDEISRTGDKWVVLGEIGEFMPMFQVVDSITKMEDELQDRNDISSIATRMSETPGTQPAQNRERIRTSIQYGNENSPEASQRPSPQRAEDITKKVRPSQITPAGVLVDSDDEPTTPGPVRTDGTPVPVDAATSRDDWNIDLADEAETSGMYPSQPKRSRGIGLLLTIGLLGVLIAAAYSYLVEGPTDSTAEKVVTIGKTNQSQTAEVDPQDVLDDAVTRALSAAHAENDARWTMWHDTASRPFYIALDTAYAAADEASVTVELEDALIDARIALENGKLEDASRKFQLVLAKNPGNPAATTGLGWALLELGRADQALAQFKLAVDRNPEFPDAYIGLGTAHRQLGDPKKAYDAYDLYLGRFPKGEKASIASYQMKQLKKQLGL